MYQLTINIDSQNIPKIVNRFVPTENSLNQYSVLFTYSDTQWETLTKYGVFSLGGTSTAELSLLSNNECYVPSSVLTGGSFEMCLIGILGDIEDSDTVSTRYTTKSIVININGNNVEYIGLGEMEDDDIWQQYLTEIQGYATDAINSATEANDSAMRAEDALEKYPYIGDNKHWYIYDVTTGEYVDTGVNASGGIYNLPNATTTTLGGMIIGDYLVGSDGVVSVDDTKIATIEYVDEKTYDYDITYGDGLLYDETTKVLSVDVVNEAYQDNTKPITSGAVYKELGNIDVLLSAI